MGALFTRPAALLSDLLEDHRVKKAGQRLSEVVDNAWWLGGHIVWTSVISALLLGVPVFYSYERECQMLDTHYQMQQAQMQAASAQQGQPPM